MQNSEQSKVTGSKQEETTKSSDIAVSQKTNLLASLTKEFVDLPPLSDEDDSDVDSIESGVVDPSFVETASKVLFGQASGQPDLRAVDPETIEAILEAAGIGKSNPFNGKQPFDTSGKLASVKDEEAEAELTWMKVKAATTTANISGPMGTVAADADQMRLMDDGKALQDTEESESLLSLACSGGYFELAQVLLKINANVEDRGSKRDCTPLMEAASAGHEDIVNLLLEYEADVNAQSSAGNTPLMYACSGGHEEIVRLLLDHGAKIEDHNENGHTPLMEAASSGHVGIARILLERGAGINTHSTEFKESALTLACYKGHLEMVKFLLDAGADHEHKTDEMHTALMEASMDGHVEVARLLLDHGAQVNMPTDSFESPLTLAACGGHTKLASLLLERGANIEEVNDEGYTPLMEAAREGHEEMVALLLAQGADINAQTEETQETALTLACCGGFLEVAKFLIDVDADIELGCSTPLMEASQEGQVELVKFLLSKGANVHATTATGDTALTYACENGHTEVASYLLDAGADLEHESEGGRTPLMKAARAGHFCSVRFLISRGADVNRSTTNNDHTVLSLACAGGHLSVVELLLNHNADPSHKLKDNSTSLIEASKGGHAAVMARILNYPGNMIPVDGTTTPPTPEQGEIPRVPIQALPTMVPPQEPDKHPEDLMEYHGTMMQDNATDPMDLITEDALYGGGQQKIDLGELSEIAFKNAARGGTGKFKTAEEQILEKQQIIAELQKVERELQQRMEYQQAESKKLAKKKEELSSGGKGKGTAIEGAATPGLGETNNNKESPESPNGGGFGADLSLDERDIKLGGSPPMPTEFEIPSYLNGISGDVVMKDQASTATHLPGFFLQNLPFSSPSTSLYEGGERPATEGQEDFRRLEVFSSQMEEFAQEEVETQTKVMPQTQSVGTQCGGGSTHNASPAPSSPSFTPHPPVEIDAQTESNHDTALTIACAGGYDDVVQMLLEKHADIEHRDKKGFTPLILAATAGHYKTVKILLGHKAEIEAQSERTKDTPLSLACSGGRYEVVELLLKHNANKEHRNVSDYTPLSLAASGGYVNIIKLLLKCGAEINSRTGSKLGISPLMLAAMNGHTPAVKLLLDNGSDINAQIETNRNTALTLACFQGRTEVVSLLVDRKANVEHRAKTGLTPLMEAASGGYAEVGSVLINKGADVNAPPVPSSRDTALTIAADKGHYKFVELLLYHKAAVDVKNKKGQSPLWLACNGGHLDVVQLLVKEGADIDSQDNRKMSCLMAAFRKGHVKVVRWMVKHVNQFPSDAECFRFIATISDKELHKKCNTSFEIIVVAKDRQAAEANKNANSLLEELESEKTREETRKVAQAKRKEKKRKKRKEKQQKVVTPEPKVENEEEEEEEEVEDSPPSSTAESLEERVPLAPPSATTTTTIGVVRTTDTIVRTSGAKKSRLAPSIAAPPAAPLIITKATLSAPVTTSKATSEGDNRSEKRQKIRDRKEQKKMKADERRSVEENRGKGRNKKKLNHSLKDEYNNLSSMDGKFTGDASLPTTSPKKGQRREEGWKEVVRKSKKVIIPSSSISRVIGRNGVNINAIRDVTGAHIDVERQNNKGGERNINIKGSAEATRQAAQLITALIKEPDRDISELMNRVRRTQPATAQTTTTTASQKLPLSSSAVAPRFKSSAPSSATTSKPLLSQATISQFLTKSLAAAPRGPGTITRTTGTANMRWGAPQQLKLPTTTHSQPPPSEGPRFSAPVVVAKQPPVQQQPQTSPMVYQPPPSQDVTPTKTVVRCLFKPDDKGTQEYAQSSSLFGRAAAEKPPARNQELLYATAPIGPISKPVSAQDSAQAFAPESQLVERQETIAGASSGHGGGVTSSMGQGSTGMQVQKGITTNVGQNDYSSDMSSGAIPPNIGQTTVPSNRAPGPMTSTIGGPVSANIGPSVMSANMGQGVMPQSMGQGHMSTGMTQGAMPSSLSAPGSIPQNMGQGVTLMSAPSLNDTLGYRGDVNDLWNQPISHIENHHFSEESKAPGYKRHSMPIQAPIGQAPMGLSRSHSHTTYMGHQMYPGAQSYPKNPYGVPDGLSPSSFAPQMPDMNNFATIPPPDGHAPTPPPNGSPVSPGASPRSGTASPSQEKKIMMPIGTERQQHQQHQRKPPVGFAAPGNPLASGGNIWSYQGDKGTTPWFGMRDVDEGASSLPSLPERPYPTGQMGGPMMNSAYRVDIIGDGLHPGMAPQLPYDLSMEGSGGLWNPAQAQTEQSIEWMWRQQTM